MTRPVDVATFEATLIRHCSPTIAGLKPAALFTYSGVYATEPEASQAEIEAVEARRGALSAVISVVGKKLEAFHIKIETLVWRGCGALIYVYRPAELRAYLLDPLASIPLQRAGYDPDDPEGCIPLLAARIAQASAHHAECAIARTPCARSCRCAFPHEMGFFLGYPYEDVLGFIEHEGRDYLAVGPWKVYAHLDRALQTFTRYRRCTETLTARYRSGCGIETLACRHTTGSPVAHAASNR